MGLEQSLKCDNFMYGGVNGFFDSSHKISLNCGKSYKDSPQ